MRLLVIASKTFADLPYTKEVLDRLTIDADDVMRVTGEELECRTCSIWFHDRWLRGVRKGKQKFAVNRYHPLDWSLKKDAMYKAQWKEMVLDCDLIVYFWEPGPTDFRIQGLLRMAELYDRKVKKVLV